MYTTWNDNYSQLQNFATAARKAWPGYVASIAPKSGTLRRNRPNRLRNPLQGARVTLTGAGLSSNVTTDANGNYNSGRFRPAYTVSEVAATGFAGFANPIVVITAGQTTTVNVRLTSNTGLQHPFA